VEETDPWVGSLREVLRDRTGSTLKNACLILQIPFPCDLSTTLRVSRCFKKMGWKSKVEWINGKAGRIYRPKEWLWMEEKIRLDRIRDHTT